MDTQTPWEALLNKLSSWVDVAILNLPNFLIAILVFTISFWLGRHLQSWTEKGLKRFIQQPSIRGLIARVASITLIIIGLILSLVVLNLDDALNTILAGAGVAGLAVSLALQGTLANTFSGVYLAINDEIKIGDWVETNGFSGKVQEIELRNTKIKEADNNIVIIPNKLILESPFKNYGLTQRIRTTITCGVGYESSLPEVKEIATSAIEDIFPTEAGENIEFYFTEFGDSSINFLLRFWVDAQEKLTALEVKSQAIIAIKEAFDEHSINIPFPIRTLIQEEAVVA